MISKRIAVTFLVNESYVPTSYRQQHGLVVFVELPPDEFRVTQVDLESPALHFSAKMVSQLHG